MPATAVQVLSTTHSPVAASQVAVASPSKPGWHVAAFEYYNTTVNSQEAWLRLAGLFEYRLLLPHPTTPGRRLAAFEPKITAFNSCWEAACIIMQDTRGCLCGSACKMEGMWLHVSQDQ
jgi:hypothetical protein